MSKLTAKDMNRLYAAYVADPSGQADQFWSAVRSWVIRCSYSIPAGLKDDLVQDALVSIMESLSSYDAIAVDRRVVLTTFIKKSVVDGVVVEKAEDIHIVVPGKGDFIKWANGIIRNKRNDSYRRQYGSREDSISELGTWQEDGSSFLEFDPAQVLKEPDANDLVTDEDRAIKASLRLDDLRGRFRKQEDRDLFDQLRAGKSLDEAADVLGQSYAATQSRFCRWKNKVALKEPAGLPFSERNTDTDIKRAA